MEFREREGTISFEEAERRYAELERRHDAGEIDEEQFDAERQRLLVRDDEGRWWAKSWETGQWHYHDGDWIEATPPVYRGRVSSEDYSPGRTEQDLPERYEPRPTARPPGSRSRLLIGLGVLCAVLAVGLIAALAYPLLSSGEDTTEETEPETANLTESIVGEWSGTDNGEAISIRFFADGTTVGTSQVDTDIATYRFADEDTITVIGGPNPEERYDISMPTEDSLTLIPLDKDGNPKGGNSSQEDALVLRKTADYTEEAEPETADFAESIVGEWRGTENGEAISTDFSMEFFADGRLIETERGRTNDGTYRFVDEDTITASGNGPEVRFDISMPTEDTLILLPLDKDGNPRADPLVLRK